METSTFVGRAVGATATPYGAFTDQRTGEKKEPGVSYRLYVSKAYDEAPVEIRVPEAMFTELPGEFGTEVSVTVEVRARSNRIERKLLQVEVIREPAAR